MFQQKGSKKKKVRTGKKLQVSHTSVKLTSGGLFCCASRIIFMYLSNWLSVFPSSPHSSSSPDLLSFVSSSSFLPGSSTSCNGWLGIKYVNIHAAEKVRKRCLTKIILTVSSSSVFSSWCSFSLASSCSISLSSSFSFSHLCSSASSSSPPAVSPGAWAASVTQSNFYEFTQQCVHGSNTKNPGAVSVRAMVYRRVWPSIIPGHLKLFVWNSGTKISPVWPSRSEGSSGGSGEWETVGWTGASSLREAAVSRRSSGMWLGSGGRQTKRSFMFHYNATSLEDQHRIHNQLLSIFTIVCHHWKDTCEAAHSLIKNSLSRTQNPPHRIYGYLLLGLLETKLQTWTSNCFRPSIMWEWNSL